MGALFAGRLAGLALTAVNTDTVMYTVPTGRRASFSLSVCNRGTSSTKFSVALCRAGQNPPVPNDDWIEYETLLTSKATFERTGLALADGQRLAVKDNGNNLSFVVYGVEEDIA